MRTFIVSVFLFIINIQVYSQDLDFEEFRKNQVVSEAKMSNILEQLLNPSLAKDRIFTAWEKDVNYYIGDMVKHDGKTYESTMDENTTIPSDTNKAWKSAPSSEITIEGINVNGFINWWEFNKKISEKFRHLADSTGQMNAQPMITFRNCKFAALVLRNLTISHSLTFINCNIRSLELESIRTENLTIQYCSLQYIFIGSSDINRAYIGNNKQRSESLSEDSPDLGLSLSKFGSFQVSNLANFAIRSHICSFLGDTLSNQSFRKNTLGIVSLNNSLKVFKSVFGAARDSSVVNLTGNFSRIEIDSSSIHSNINLSSIVQEKLQLTHNTLNGLISINNAILPSDVKIRWNQLAGQKIAEFGSGLLWDSKTGTYKDQQYFKSSYEDGISNLDHYEDIMHSYQTLYTYYKNAGDLESANSCFSEMKDIQTERYAYLFTQEKTFKSFFRWKLAQLMKFYTSHGTDPARAIVISMWVMLAFAVFYFFFPSDWDVTSKSKLISNYKDFIEKNDKGYVKPFFVLTLGFGVSLLNAFTLSVNSFTTLGFGNIPTHGIAKYFCVLEGFIGWFLLSIFTVALINQVLG